MDNAQSEDRALSEGSGWACGWLSLSQSCPPDSELEEWSSDEGDPPGGTEPDLCSLSVSPVSALGLGSGEAPVSSLSAPSVSVASSSTSGLALASGLGIASGLSLASGLGLALDPGLGLWSSSGLPEAALTASTLDAPDDLLEWDAETARDPTTIAEPAIATAAARRVPSRAIALLIGSVIAYLLPTVGPVPGNTFTCRTPIEPRVTIRQLGKASAAVLVRWLRPPFWGGPIRRSPVGGRGRSRGRLRRGVARRGRRGRAVRFRDRLGLLWSLGWDSAVVLRAWRWVGALRRLLLAVVLGAAGSANRRPSRLAATRTVRRGAV